MQEEKKHILKCTFLKVVKHNKIKLCNSSNVVSSSSSQKSLSVLTH